MQISVEAIKACPDLCSTAKLAQTVLVKVVICSGNVPLLAGGSSLFGLILNVSFRKL